MTTEIMVNILSILAICISLASVALCIYGRVQERRVAAAIASVRIRTPRTPPLMANRGADVTPVKHGRWIKNDPHCDGLAFLWNCSECGEESDEGYRYCPNCGARMDGGDD